MLNQTDLTRVDLNLLVLFEIVLEERHVGQAAGNSTSRRRRSVTVSGACGGCSTTRCSCERPRAWCRPTGRWTWRNPVADFLRERGACRHCRAVRPGYVHAPFHDRRARWGLGRVPVPAARRTAPARSEHQYQRAAALAASQRSSTAARLGAGARGAGNRDARCRNRSLG